MAEHRPPQQPALSERWHYNRKPQAGEYPISRPAFAGSRPAGECPMSNTEYPIFKGGRKKEEGINPRPNIQYSTRNIQYPRGRQEKGKRNKSKTEYPIFNKEYPISKGKAGKRKKE
jgi:hypothetical protein